MALEINVIVYTKGRLFGAIDANFYSECLTLWCNLLGREQFKISDKKRP
jgi:hypothetical protein